MAVACRNARLRSWRSGLSASWAVEASRSTPPHPIAAPPTNTVASAKCLNLTGAALLGEPVQFMLCSCLLPLPTSAVVGVVIVASSLDGHIGLAWTAGGKVRNLDFTAEGGAHHWHCEDESRSPAQTEIVQKRLRATFWRRPRTAVIDRPGGRA